MTPYSAAAVGRRDKPIQLPFGLLVRFFGHFRIFDLFAKFLGFHRLFVFIAQFALDGFHLLAQEIFALNFFDLAARFVLDLLPNLQNFGFTHQQADQFLQLSYTESNSRISCASFKSIRWKFAMVYTVCKRVFE